MQSLKSSILRHFRVEASFRNWSFVTQNANLPGMYSLRLLCIGVGKSHDQVLDRVIGLVKKFDKTDAAKVTKTADFQKDLSLDSLDRVELVMAFEQEFSIEIPDEEADKFKCCADVARYILAGSEPKPAEKS